MNFRTFSQALVLLAFLVLLGPMAILDAVSAKEVKQAEDTDSDIKIEVSDTYTKEGKPAKAIPVSSDPVRIYGWREDVIVDGMTVKIKAKLDTGALTSSIHAEQKELFERNGKKWVRFTVVAKGKGKKNSKRVRLEAPLVRVARIKEPGGASQSREVVKLSFKIGDRKLRGDFSLNNRSNMLCPVLIGRSILSELGWVDASRVYLADDKVVR